MQFKNPKYFIDKDHLALAQLTIITPSGKEYHYDNAAALNYTATNVEVHFDPINAGMLAANTSNANKQTIQQQNVKLGTSDVDENIPENPTTNNKTFAVVIANQNYTNVAGVPLALNDGLAFSKYCEKTLGMPAENVRYYADASYGICSAPSVTSRTSQVPSMATSTSCSTMPDMVFQTRQPRMHTSCLPTPMVHRQKAATHSTSSIQS